MHVLPHRYGECKSGAERSKRKRKYWVLSQVRLSWYWFMPSDRPGVTVLQTVHVSLQWNSLWPRAEVAERRFATGGGLHSAFWLVYVVLVQSLNSLLYQ